MRRSHIIHVLFDVSVVAKGTDGALEIIGGALLFFVNPIRIQNFARILSQHELNEDSHDVFASFLLNSTQHASTGARAFASIYLLWHGAAKAALVTALLLRQRWECPAAILAFLAYQLHRYSHTHAPALLVLSVVDVFVTLMTWLEYKRLMVAPATL
jgi:uncharacterized membrane protein